MYITPNWPAPKNIKAFTTLRSGGTSLKPYDQFNLAEHVGDNPAHVHNNRNILKKTLNLPNEPIWIKQTHSNIAIQALPENRDHEADATYSDQIHHICIVLTADCLPILLCNRDGTHIAAIHAGWRGLLNGIIESTLQQLNVSPEEILAWLGPAISPANYEVGEEIRSEFLAILPEAKHAFVPSAQQRWLADLYQLARLLFLKQGVTNIFGGQFCTYADSTRFYSYRRDGAKTGRMATLIWNDANQE